MNQFLFFNDKRYLIKNNIKFILAFIYFLNTTFSGGAQVQRNPPSNDSIVQVYNNRALRLMNEGKIDECADVIYQTLKIEENPVSYCLLSHVYNIEKNYDEAIKYGNLAIKVNPNFMPTYNELFNAYYSSNHFKAAEDIIEYCEKIHVSGFSPEQKETIENAIKIQKNTNIFILFFLITIACVFIIKIYNTYINNENYFLAGSGPGMSAAFLVGAFISCCLYLLFFTLSKWIWSFNPKIPANLFALNIRPSIFDHDGIESFALYSMLFINLMLTLLFTPLILRLKKYKYFYIFTILFLFLAAWYYFYLVGFNPPMQAIGSGNILAPAFLVLISFGLYIINLKNSLLSKVIVVVLIAFCSLISIGPASLYDLIYILAPSLRLLKGFKVSEIYFQYDIFLSLLGAAWMKLNFALDWFPYLGQIGFFLFFLASFYFADGFFKSKGLSVIFIIGLVLVRFYSIWGDIPTILQATPLRLDLWMILLFLAYEKGIYHWSVGIALGLLVLFHRNLGLIYLASYMELVALLFLLDNVSLALKKKWNKNEIITLLKNHLRLNIINITIVCASIGLCFVLFHEFFSKSASIYRKLGVGMIPISSKSFYWYVPVVLSCLASFIYYYRNKLGAKYTNLSLFIVLLVIGNSIYFFGRSHENNILNDSGILVLALFVLFDILIFLAIDTPVFFRKKLSVIPQHKPHAKKNEKQNVKNNIEISPIKGSYFFTWKRLSLVPPFLFIFLAGYFYSERIVTKSGIQVENLAKGQISYPFIPIPIDTIAVRAITHNSSKVYFLDFDFDFFDYYYGNYTPQGYYNPCSTWVFKKDVVDFLQDLLNKGYYIVYNANKHFFFNEYLLSLNYNQSSQRNSKVAISKQNTPLLLPESPSPVYHVSIKDSLAVAGLDYSGLKLSDIFTIEVFMKPLGSQLSSAAILNNLNKTDGMKGFTLQHNGNSGDQYGFGFSVGGQSLASAFFHLDPDKWHYLVIVANKEALKVYDNGNIISNTNVGGLAYINSDIPLTIGNQASEDSHFSGFIREVKISDGNISDAEILSNAQKLSQVSLDH